MKKGRGWPSLKNYEIKCSDMQHAISGQSYKATTIVIYESRVVNVSNLLVITTIES